MDKKIISFTIHQNPVPQGRPRFASKGRGGKPLPFVRTYDPAKSRDWKKVVAEQAMLSGANVLLEGPLKMVMTFRLARPKSLPKKTIYHIKKPDVSNLAKGIEDALEGFCYPRDQQIVESHLFKEYERAGFPPCVIITIEQI